MYFIKSVKVELSYDLQFMRLRVVCLTCILTLGSAQFLSLALGRRRFFIHGQSIETCSPADLWVFFPEQPTTSLIIKPIVPPPLFLLPKTQLLICSSARTNYPTITYLQLTNPLLPNRTHGNTVLPAFPSTTCLLIFMKFVEI